tara:strand:+ start:44523 stop:45740 length:1218 start_codon:yes stop_codon:yes gene_type:complete
MSKVIWILNQTSGTPDSGWGERHYSFAKQWKEKGYKTYIFSGSYNHLFRNQPKVGPGNLTIESIEDGITFCWVKNPKYKDGGFTKFWSNIIYTIRLLLLNLKEIPKPDIVLVSSMPIFPIIAGNIFKRKYKSKKLIIEIRDLWPLTPIYLKGYSKRNPLVLILSWFEKYAYRKSDKIVSVLPNANIHINPISNHPEKFHYIPNGIDIKLADSNELPTEIISMIPKDKFIIGYAGTIGFANAMEYFIEASRLLKNNHEIHFVLVGDGVFVPKLKSLLDKDQNNITFIPKIAKSQVQTILHYFDVCYLSRYQSDLYKYGVSYNKYFDYMLAKKPILESSEFIKDQVEMSGCGIIVKPEDATEIVNGIHTLFNMSEDQKKELGKKGYNYVKKYHNFEYLSDLYLKVFN